MRKLLERDYQELLRLIQEAKETSTMERASFDPIAGGRNPEDAPQEPGESVTDFVRRRTRLWRSSWLTGPLEAAEEILTKKARRD